MSQAISPVPPRPWQHPAFLATLGVALLAAAALPFLWGPLSGWLYEAEYALTRLLPSRVIDGAGWAVLPIVAFGAGLLACMSPCVLPLVPLNLAMIGVSEAGGPKAVALSARFVLGAALALAALGLFADVAGFLLIQQRGPVFIAVGTVMLALGLVSLEVLPLPFAGRAPGGAGRLGPTAAGAAFALITSPCASPLLAAVLAAASAQAVPGLSVVTMLAFSLGYTSLVFVTGAFGGRWLGRLRRIGLEAPRAVAAALLLVAGLGFTVSGIAWF